MIILEDHLVTVTMGAGGTITEYIDMRKYSRMLVHLPASGWNAGADLSFLVATESQGTYIPLIDESGNPVEIQNFFWGSAYCAPDQVGKARYVRLWSCVASGATSVAQDADRVFSVELKT